MRSETRIRQRTTVPGEVSWPDLALLAGLAAAAHFLFSAFGYNPTDDGFVLAMSRRLLEGEVPHRDFISIRPVLSAVLHIPVVALGGAMTHWLGRLVGWCELAVIAGVWVQLVSGLMGRKWSFSRRVLYVSIGFMLSAHTFPVMPWYTVDGLLLGSVGLLLAAPWRPNGTYVGLALVGAAGLCKQNFFALVPVGLVFSGGLRRPGCWLAAMAPLLIYAGYLLATGAARDAATQLTTATDVLAYGVWPFLRSPFLAIGTGIGFTISWLSRIGGRGGEETKAPVALLLTYGILLIVGAFMIRDLDYLFKATYLLFGAALGATMERLVSRGWRDDVVQAGTLALVVAWITSVSLGYCSPALMAGGLAVFLLALGTEPSSIDEGSASPRARPPSTAIAARNLRAVTAFACLLALAWGRARFKNVYRDLPAWHLHHRLDDVLPGGKLIRTGPQTHAMMADLHRAIARTGNRPFAIIPDFTGYWVKSPQRNPLAVDFVNSDELGHPILVAKVMVQLEDLRGRGYLIVGKADARNVAREFVPLANDSRYYPLVGYVRSHFTKVAETEWFELYQ